MNEAEEDVPCLDTSEYGKYERAWSEGWLAALKRVLLVIGSKRFGPPDEATRAAIEAIKEEETLSRLFDHILVVASWPVLLAFLDSKKYRP